MASIAPPSHTRRTTTTDDWITPKWLIDRLGLFDLDPCESASQPWPCAGRGFTVRDDGLVQAWSGEVWLNPPYGRMASRWLSRLAAHGNGMALVFARTDTRMFFEWVWPGASRLLFLRGRLTFCHPDGRWSKAGHNSGGPSVLIAYGARSAGRLERVADLGAMVEVRRAERLS